ncbi:ADP-ribosyltransferase-containing protein [Helicobacter sp. T3_23-1056]
MLEKEQQAIYGVVYKGEHKATIYKDLQKIDEAILLQKGDKKKGGAHIKLEHTQDTAQVGYVTPDEVKNIGQNARKYIKEFGNPYNDGTGKIYEWQDEKGVNFRLVVREISGGNESLPSANEDIITFYSNRNLPKDKNFQFKNPKVSEKYKNTLDFLPRLQKIKTYSNFDGRLLDMLESKFSDFHLPQSARDRIYNTYIKKDSSLKGNDFRIDGDDIFVSAKISPEAMNEAIKELLNTPTIKKDGVFYATKRKYKNFGDTKIVNLLDFMKDSHSLTKDENGVPREFYHGARVAKGDDIEIFDTHFARGHYEHNAANLPFGFYFSTDKKVAKGYTHNDNEVIKKVFLKIKKPFVVDFGGKSYNAGIDDAVSEIVQGFDRKKHDGIIYKNIIDDNAQDETYTKIADTFIVFDSNQIKAVANKGTFDSSNPNIYHANATLGGGVLGGSIAGLEYDENGNATGFSPQNFALGFASGALASKGLQTSIKRLEKFANKNPKAKALLERIKTKHAKNQGNLATIPNQNPQIDKIKPQKPQGQNQMKLDKFLDSKGKMSEESLRPYAMPMPKQNFSNTKEFKALFSDTQGNFGFIKTPYKEVKVNMSYAYRHFYDNTYKTNRDNIKSAFFDTFRDPLFIAKNDSKGRDSVYFFKPFLDKNENVMSLFGIGIDKNGKVDFKTFYLDNSGARIREMQKLADENILYVKNE